MNPNYGLVSARARHVCEYCRAPETFFNLPFEIEHIIPQSRGGETSPDNLALACRSCNIYKSNHIAALDEHTQTEIRIFHPRHDMWLNHFSIIEETGEIVGLTAVGRATIPRLRINSPAQVRARWQWLRLRLMPE